MVKKSTKKWKMCVDFIDMNKACPNDSFYHLKIDRLVDSTIGYRFLSSLDANSGYPQILVHLVDNKELFAIR